MHDARGCGEARVPGTRSGIFHATNDAIAFTAMIDPFAGIEIPTKQTRFIAAIILRKRDGRASTDNPQSTDTKNTLDTDHS
jgi:hypothetical protein